MLTKSLFVIAALLMSFGAEATFDVQYFSASDQLCFGSPLNGTETVAPYDCVTPFGANADCRIRFVACEPQAGAVVYAGYLSYENDTTCSASNGTLGFVQVSAFCNMACGVRVKVTNCTELAVNITKITNGDDNVTAAGSRSLEGPGATWTWVTTIQLMLNIGAMLYATVQCTDAVLQHRN